MTTQRFPTRRSVHQVGFRPFPSLSSQFRVTCRYDVRYAKHSFCRLQSPRRLPVRTFKLFHWSPSLRHRVHFRRESHHHQHFDRRRRPLLSERWSSELVQHWITRSYCRSFDLVYCCVFPHGRLLVQPIELREQPFVFDVGEAGNLICLLGFGSLPRAPSRRRAAWCRFCTQKRQGH
jgi:hypothetical protein